MVDDRFEALGAGEWIPADPSVTVLEVEGRCVPQQQAHPQAVLLDNLLAAVARREARAEKVFSLQQRSEALAFGGAGKHAHGQRTVGVRRGSGGASRFIPTYRALE